MARDVRRPRTECRASPPDSSPIPKNREIRSLCDRIPRDFGDGVRRRARLGAMTRIAFLGMGVMGAPMARHLAKAGHQVVVYNRNAAKALAWVALNGNQAAPTPAEAAADADIVALCVGNDDDVREVVLGLHGALSAMSAGSDPDRPHDRVGRPGPGACRRRAPSTASGSSTPRCPVARPGRRTVS